MSDVSQEDIKRDFAMRVCSGSEEDIMYGLIGIGMHLYDYDYVIAECKKLANTDSAIILRGVIFALGHLSRNFNDIDTSVVRLVITKGLKSQDKVTVDAAKNLRSDVQGLLKKNSI
jgi:hypothetical protein